jgi:hypothetical protein
MYKEMIVDYQAQLKALLEKDIPEFNDLLKQKDLQGIISQIK